MRAGSDKNHLWEIVLRRCLFAERFPMCQRSAGIDEFSGRPLLLNKAAAAFGHCKTL